MPDPSTHRITSIIDNDADNTLCQALVAMAEGGRELLIASAFFSLDALNLIAPSLSGYQKIRILFGDDSSPRQVNELLSRLQQTSDPDLLRQREDSPLLTSLEIVNDLFARGIIEARCYTKKKFHAKAYIVTRDSNYAPVSGIAGSGNFTRPGLTQNIELNVDLYREQAANLKQWFEERWEEAAADIVTREVQVEIQRQIRLYDPYVLYLKTLLTWGQYVQGTQSTSPVNVYDQLDPHQQHAYHQALRILERNNGVMICDGVGLGKSYIALGLLEKLLRDGERVLLLAPKSIVESSWRNYEKEYLAEFKQPFGSLDIRPLTDLGFPPDDGKEREVSKRLKDKRNELQRLWQRATVVLVDESHNFRTTASARYQNLHAVTRPYDSNRKKVILLTATPINNSFRDLSAQLALITQSEGNVGGYTSIQISRLARTLDRDRTDFDPSVSDQLVFDLFGNNANDAERSFRTVLEQVMIQRSRQTCKALSKAADRPIHFPRRNGPIVLEYTIDDGSPLANALTTAEKRFKPFTFFLQRMQDIVMEATGEDAVEEASALLSEKLKRHKGIKLAAFLPEQYQNTIRPGGKVYKDEVRLAGLVFANTLKQLESSMPAFQSIIQSLAVGLLARLEFMLGEDARQITEKHYTWASTDIFINPEDEDLEDELDLLDDGASLDQSGADIDDWITKAISTRKLEKKLSEYTNDNFKLDKWRDDIIQDLEYLQEIHNAIIVARSHDDPKMERLLPEVERCLQTGSKVLIFTQSQRTAEYLENVFRERLAAWTIARIDSRVGPRAAILHAFCPNYNQEADGKHPTVPESIDLLISTDVLSEGVNLQEVGAIFNWDIHWNPVRLIQRIGRVDRRLDPEKTPVEHEFTIYNVFPPENIEKVIKLVGTVERRTINISRSVGIDLAFFSGEEPSGTLREFNARYEGKMTATDEALQEYVTLQAKPPAALLKQVQNLPAGAFGVWDRAPFDGLFALFTMETEDNADAATARKFASVIHQPVLALQNGSAVTVSAGDILAVLRDTVPGAKSGSPGPEESLSKGLKRLRNHVRQSFSEIELPSSIKPRLVCWMQLRKSNS